jgi:CBS domain-containing protein
MENVLVADIMTREPITTKPDINLLDSAKKMVKKKLGSLLIVDKKNLLGFISQKDILWALVKKSKEDLSKIKAIDISPKKIVTIKPSATIEEALQKMKKAKFERLPVVHEKELVGIITIKDILNFHPEFYPELEELAQIREEAKKLKRIKKAEQVHEGICEECGNLDILRKFNGMMICESCRNSM